MKGIDILRPATIEIAEKKHVVVLQIFPRLGWAQVGELLDYRPTRVVDQRQG